MLNSVKAKWIYVEAIDPVPLKFYLDQILIRYHVPEPVCKSEDGKANADIETTLCFSAKRFWQSIATIYRPADRII
jgi:hypothetical protein